MLITYYGHSQFLLESADGFRVFTDPCRIGYPLCREPIDAVTISHGHHDHNDAAALTGSPCIVDKAGTYSLSGDTSVLAIPSVHDNQGGAQRGSNLIMKIVMDDLSIVHLGDQGDQLTKEQISALGRVDILLVPVGGHFTIDAEGAAKIVRNLKPTVVIPMHYRTDVIRDWPIADETAFVSLMGAPTLTPAPLLRVTDNDLSQQPPIFLLDYAKAP